MDVAALFDPARVRAHRARAARRFEEVLLARIAEEIAERLEGVNRSFGLSLVIGAGGTFARQLAQRPDLAARAYPLIAMDVCESMVRAPLAIAGDAEALPIRDGALGLIASLLTLHWANDLPGALIQMRRALAPDGLMIASLFGAGTLSELRHALLIAESEVQGGAGPRVSPFADAADAAQLLMRAGFALPVVDTHTLTLRYAHPLKLVADLRAMGETNALRMRPGKPLTRAVAARMIEVYGQKFADPDGRVRASFEILTLTGWAAHQSQQVPLRPGSARARLADALGVKEQSAGEATARPGAGSGAGPGAGKEPC